MAAKPAELGSRPDPRAISRAGCTTKVGGVPDRRDRRDAVKGSAGERNVLRQLYDQGQSPWVDDISRKLLASGKLAVLVEQGILGLTSNPAIFRRAIGGSSTYNDEIRRLAREGKSGADIYDTVVLDDIRSAATILRPVYDAHNGHDGLVSIEVPPSMAYDAEQTLREARRILASLDLPNVMIKIPGTAEGIAAIQQATAGGINVTVTVLFSRQSYRQAAQAYVAGLEQRVSRGLPVDRIASVAAFYISRVDAAVDSRLGRLLAATDDEKQKTELRALQGKAAIANAKLAYAAFQEIFSGPRWEALSQVGARAQRCLWASTGSKNPAYSDVRYVEELIGPDTVNTMPPTTITAFLDHGRVERTLDRDIDQACEVVAALDRVGISLDEIAEQLQRDTLRRFSEDHDELINTISARRDETMAHSG